MIPNHFDEQILNNDLILKFACCSFFDRKRTKKNEMKIFKKTHIYFFQDLRCFKIFYFYFSTQYLDYFIFILLHQSLLQFDFYH